MKAKDCYDAEYENKRWDRPSIFRPAITARRARQIFAAAESKMDAFRPATVNKILTVGQAYGILVAAVTDEMSDETVLHSLVSRNIVREFGKFL
jgi:hypothetical protein